MATSQTHVYRPSQTPRVWSAAEADLATFTDPQPGDLVLVTDDGGYRLCVAPTSFVALLPANAAVDEKLEDTTQALVESIPTADSTIVLSSGGGVTQTATITMKDKDGATIAVPFKVEVYMATDATGETPSTSGTQVDVVATTGAVLKEITSKLHFDVVTADTGIAVLEFDNTGGGGAYTDRVVLVLPSGQLVVSAALNVATA